MGAGRRGCRPLRDAGSFHRFAVPLPPGGRQLRIMPTHGGGSPRTSTPTGVGGMPRRLSVRAVPCSRRLSLAHAGVQSPLRTEGSGDPWRRVVVDVDPYGTPRYSFFCNISFYNISETNRQQNAKDGAVQYSHNEADECRQSTISSDNF